jgi:hypothetical protein
MNCHELKIIFGASREWSRQAGRSIGKNNVAGNWQRTLVSELLFLRWDYYMRHKLRAGCWCSNYRNLRHIADIQPADVHVGCRTSSLINAMSAVRS